MARRVEVLLANLNVSVHFIHLDVARLEIPHPLVEELLAALSGPQQDAEHGFMLHAY
jgi:hypothetical protein